MRRGQVKLAAPGGSGPTRRELLGAAAAAAVGAFVGPVRGSVVASPASQSATPPTPHPTSQTMAAGAVPRPWWLGASFPRSRVVRVMSTQVLRVAGGDEVVLREMLDLGLQVLTGERTSSDAWHSVLGSARHTVLKFNQVGAEVLGTNDAVGTALGESLRDAGYEPGTLTLVEAPARLTRELGTRVAEPGWGTSIPIGGGTEELAAYLLAADAVVNVPLLKTHRLAGMSGALKNLSHAVIRHPARYHDHGCAPYVGQVVGNKEVSGRLRLTIVNALRLVVRNGPDARADDVVPFGGLLLGFDPVALDAVGLELLEEQGRKLAVETPLRIPYLEAAAEDAVGRRAPAELDHVVARHGA